MDSRDRKVKKIEVLCTENQFEKISEKAKKYAMSNSEFGLFTMINSRIDVSIGYEPTLAKIERALNLLEKGVIDEKEFLKLKYLILKEQE